MRLFDFFPHRISGVPGDGVDPEILHTVTLRYQGRLSGWILSIFFLAGYPGSQETV